MWVMAELLAQPLFKTSTHFGQENEVDSFYVQCQIHEAVAYKLKTGAFPFCCPKLMCLSYIRHIIFLLGFLLYKVNECSKHLY